MILEVFSNEQDRISVVIDPTETDLMVNTDQRLLQLCLEQILDNAIKYSPEEEKITLRFQKHNSQIYLDITDNGPGFSKKALAHLYEMFSADNLRYRSHGFGIGLATVKTILDTMLAKLEIKNLPQKGALVRIIFS